MLLYKSMETKFCMCNANAINDEMVRVTCITEIDANVIQFL